MISLLILFCCVFGSTVGQKIDDGDLYNDECGKREGLDINQEVGVYKSEPGKFPWHVAIYRYNELHESYDNICGGTIISPNIVLTAADCVFDPENNTTFEPTFLKVVAGTVSLGESTLESNARGVIVNDILISTPYLRDSRSYDDNIAVLKLVEDLEFNDLVRPVCIPWIMRVESTTNRILQTAGWGLKGSEKYSTTLKEAYLEYINTADCRKKYTSNESSRYINFDKLCVLTPKGRKDYDTGGGLVQKKGNRYYLVAILSTNIDNEFSASINITRRLDWLYRIIATVNTSKRNNLIDEEYADENAEVKNPILTRVTRADSNESGSCLLPFKPGVSTYIVDPSNCKTNLTRQENNTKETGASFQENNCIFLGGERVQPYNIVKVNCALGYGQATDSQFGVNYICNNGKWFETEPDCIKFCPALKKENLNFECTYAGKPISCNTYIRPGTKAKFRCKEFYEPSYDPSSYSESATCLPGGIWSERIPKCSLECGRVNQINNVEATLLYGNKTTYGQYPWHVAIYLLESKRYQYICGGSLVSENFILTAAHCVFHPATYEKVNKNDLKVIAGKGKSDYYTQELYQVNSDVIKIIVPDTYVGDGTRYAEDIALLQTGEYFKFNHFVLPVCLDHFGLVKFPNNVKGTIVGWGLTENGSISDELQEVHLPTLPIVQCRQLFKDFVQFLTVDKYCVIHQNGSGLGAGDSGGAVTYDVGGQHYIHGIVSIKPRDSNLFSVFTNVSVHHRWIIDSMRNSFTNVIKRECGIVKPTKNETPGYPWAVYVFGIYKNDVTFCSATLIHEFFVVTAAHCLINTLTYNTSTFPLFVAKDIHLSAGINDDPSNRQDRNVAKVIFPEGFTGRAFLLQYDIALLQVDQPFIFNDFVLPACLDRSRISFEVQPADIGTYFAWTRPKSELDDSREVILPVYALSSYECEEYFGDFTLDADKFCVLYVEGKARPFVVDYGSGVTFTYKGRHYLRGIYTQQIATIVALFTNVSVYLDWITNEIENRIVLS